jgi:hypothetical protein
MKWGFLIALVLAIPVILFPVALVWYLNAGRLIAAIKKLRAKRARDKYSGTTMPHTR